MKTETSFLMRPGGGRLAFRRWAAPTADGRPGVMLLGGFNSDMSGIKATALDEHCRAAGLGYLRFDYAGHGQSSGAFREGTIGRWRDDALAIIDELTEGSLILVGSSMGGWIMLLVALARPQRIAGLVGIAAAADFTEALWGGMAPETRARLMTEGEIAVPSAYSDEPYIITRALIEDGRRHLLLGGSIDIRCPARLFHGMADPDVPYRTSVTLAEKLRSTDVRVTLIKDGDHRLSREADLQRVFAAVDELGNA